jgi:hypothetical protein
MCSSGALYVGVCRGVGWLSAFAGSLGHRRGLSLTPPPDAAQKTQVQELILTATTKVACKTIHDWPALCAEFEVLITQALVTARADQRERDAQLVDAFGFIQGVGYTANRKIMCEELAAKIRTQELP